MRTHNTFGFALTTRCVAAMAFVPKQCLCDGVEEFEKYLQREIIPFLNGFDDSCFGI